MAQNQELPKETQERILKDATTDVVRIAELHNLSVLLTDERILNFVLDLYSAGASMGLREAMKVVKK